MGFERDELNYSNDISCVIYLFVWCSGQKKK
jgi:hypothetical protein